jgi:hypothetical protein
VIFPDLLEGWALGDAIAISIQNPAGWTRLTSVNCPLWVRAFCLLLFRHLIDPHL